MDERIDPFELGRLFHRALLDGELPNQDSPYFPIIMDMVRNATTPHRSAVYTAHSFGQIMSTRSVWNGRIYYRYQHILAKYDHNIEFRKIWCN